MLAHRLRRWANIKTTLGERLVFAVLAQNCTTTTVQILIIDG